MTVYKLPYNFRDSIIISWYISDLQDVWHFMDWHLSRTRLGTCASGATGRGSAGILTIAAAWGQFVKCPLFHPFVPWSCRIHVWKNSLTLSPNLKTRFSPKWSLFSLTVDWPQKWTVTHLTHSLKRCYHEHFSKRSTLWNLHGRSIWRVHAYQRFIKCGFRTVD